MKKLLTLGLTNVLSLMAWAGAMTELTLDCRSGMRVPEEKEEIVFSPLWATDGEGAVAVVTLNGEIVSSSDAAGTYVWTVPSERGVYNFLQETYKNGVKVGEPLKAAFVVGESESWWSAFDSTMSIEMTSKVREADPTVIDIRYKVNAPYVKVKTRILAFKDGTRSFANVVRPETFVADVDGHETTANVGDEVTANEWHNLSWKVSADWSIDLAKVKIEILVKNTGEGLAAFETMKVPGVNGHKPMIVAKRALSEAQIRDAMYWLYASKDPAITVSSGDVYVNGSEALFWNGISYSVCTVAAWYIATKMGYEPLSASDRAYVNDLGRLNLRADIPCKTVEP